METAPTEPPEAALPDSVRREKESDLLMIQWVIWKHLAPKLVMDGERMQRLAETLAHEFHQEGVRMPLDDDPVETPLTLALELHTVGEELGPVPIPQKTLRVRERQRKVAHKLYERGWRRFATWAVMLPPHAVLVLT